MRQRIGKIAYRLFIWSKHEPSIVSINLPSEVVQREAESSEDEVEFDLYMFHHACVEAWRSLNP